jgi:hypothetical protein
MFVVENICSTRFCLRASPAKLMLPTESCILFKSTNALMAEGTVLIMEIPSIVSTEVNTSLAKHTVVPSLKGTNSSKTARSKQMEVENNVRDNKAFEKLAFDQFIKLSVFLCSIITPFGRPVDPEV